MVLAIDTIALAKLIEIFNYWTFATLRGMEEWHWQFNRRTRLSHRIVRHFTEDVYPSLVEPSLNFSGGLNKLGVPPFVK